MIFLIIFSCLFMTNYAICTASYRDLVADTSRNVFVVKTDALIKGNMGRWAQTHDCTSTM